MTTPTPSVIADAQAAQRKWRIPASITIAQFALESSWGTRMPLNSNNPFGIKAVAGQPSVISRTREVDKYGREFWIDAAFRKFASLVEAFDDHGRLLATSDYYARARSMLPNANAFADALTGVYATDPNYGTALKKVMLGSNLYQYDGVQSDSQKPIVATPPAGKPIPVTPVAISEADKLNDAALRAGPRIG